MTSLLPALALVLTLGVGAGAPGTITDSWSAADIPTTTPALPVAGEVAAEHAAREAPAEPVAGEVRSRVLVSVYGGLFQPRAQGSIFDLTTANLTVDRGDFRMARGGLDVSVRIRPRLHLFLGAETGETSFSSQARPAEGGSASSPQQSTELKMNSAFHGGVAADLHRSNSGALVVQGLAGIGRSGYRFEQVGSFPDASRPGESFQGTLSTKGSGTVGFVGVRGIRSLTGPVALTVDLRAQRGEADVGGDYLDFPAISLSGFSLSVGAAMRF